jgi:uncharacterized protein
MRRQRALSHCALPVVLLLATGLLTAAAKGATVDDLYQARAIVTGRGEAERARGFALCLEDVLIKVSGDPRLTGDPALAPLLGEAAALVAAFDYRDRMAGLPLHDEQGTRDRPYDLLVSFDRARIDAALGALGRAPWPAERPRLVIVLGIHDTQTVYVLARDGERGLGQRQALAAAAAKRGMPIVLPAQAALAESSITYDRVAANRLPGVASLTQREGGDLPLVGTLVWTEAALGWTADWTITWHGATHHWQVRGVSFDDAFRNAIGGAEQLLSGHGEPR